MRVCATRQVDNEKNIIFCIARFMPGNIFYAAITGSIPKFV